MSTMTLQAAEVGHDGRAIYLTFSGPAPASHGAVDWHPGWMAGAARSLSTGGAFYFCSGSAIVNGPNLEWHVKLLVRSAADRIVYGQAGVTISGDAGLYADDQGNASAEFAAFPVTNHSWVGANGFLAAIALPGGAVQLYVSFTNGDDGRSLAQGQNVATPLKTLAAAQQLLLDNGHQFDGSRILMLEGDTELSAGFNRKCGGASYAAPFVLSTYWHDYGNGSGAQGQRAKLRAAQTVSVDRSLGGGAPLQTRYVVIDGIDVAVTDLSATFSNAAFYLGADDSDVMFIDCASARCSLGFYLDSLGTRISLVRCSVVDAAYNGGNGCSGVLWGRATGWCLISECFFDRNGYIDSALLYGSVFTRNIYVSESMTAPLMYWGGFNLRSSAEGVQLRSGGAIFGVVQDQNPMAGYIHGKGGRVAMCSTLRLTNMVVGPNPGDVLPRRWDYYVYGDYPSIIEQVVTPFASDTDTGFGCFAGRVLTLGAAPRHIIRNTTSLNRGPLEDAVDDEAYLPAWVSRSRNLVKKAGAIASKTAVRHALPAYSTWLWLASDNNCLATDAPAQFADQGGAASAIAAYRATSGQEVHSITTNPIVLNENVGLGDWYLASGGTNDADAFYAAARARARGTWPAYMDSLAAVRYIQAALAATNLPTDGNDALGVYGSTVDDPSYLNPGAVHAEARAAHPRYGLYGSPFVDLLKGRGGRRQILIMHDQPDLADPALGYEAVWYSISDAVKVGVCSRALPDVNQTPIFMETLDPTGVAVGVVQYFYDRTRAPYPTGDTPYMAVLYDTSANALDGTTLGVAGTFLPTLSQELMTDDSVGPGDLQPLYKFTCNTYADPTQDWWTDQLDAIFIANWPAEDGSGVHYIAGGMIFQVGGSRGFDDPSVDPTVIDSGEPYGFVHASATIPVGDPGSAPVLTVFAADASSFFNTHRRLVPTACVMRSQGLEGVVFLPFGNPNCDSYDFSIAAWGLPGTTHAAIARAVGGIDGIILRTGGWLSHTWINGSQIDNYSTLSSTSDPSTFPYGDYRAEFTESIVDWINGLRVHTGVQAASAPPVLIILSHWSGGGAGLEEAQLLQDTMDRALQWGVDGAYPHPHHTSVGQVWLRAVAFINPWYNVTPLQILEGTGPTKYIRKGCASYKGEWVQGHAYAAGDGVFRAEAPDYNRGNWGYWVVKAGGGHVSAGAGANGPPEDPDQTRWEMCDFTLTDTGAAHEVAFVYAQRDLVEAEMDAAADARNGSVRLGLGLGVS